MTREEFFEKFELFSELPNAVTKMRELAVGLAINGEFATNDPSELPPTFSVPSKPPDRSAFPNWWTGLLRDVLTFEYGENLPASNRAGGPYPVYGSNGIVGGHNAFTAARPVIIVGRKGSAGALNICSGPSWTTDVAYFVAPPSAVDLRFGYYLLSTLHLDSLGKGIKPGLSRSEVYALEVSIPPLAEQKRIVAKVDELMTLCDQLEAQQKERETRQAALATASVSRFGEVPTRSNLTLLFHDSYTIPPVELRSAVLTAAVQGKLVPHRVSDEPVRDLLSRNDQRRRATAARDRRADEATLELLAADDRWEIPETWEWRALADLVLFVDYRGMTPRKQTHGVRLLTARNVRTGSVILQPAEFISAEEFERWMTRGLPKAGDVLFTTEAPMGNAAVVELPERFALAQRVICFQTYGAIDPYFLAFLLASPPFQSILEKTSTGVTAKGIKASKLKQLPIAVPPAAEQRRVVATVNQLIALIDELEKQLTSSRLSASRLLEGVLEALTSDSEQHAMALPSS